MTPKEESSDRNHTVNITREEGFVVKRKTGLYFFSTSLELDEVLGLRLLDTEDVEAVNRVRQGEMCRVIRSEWSRRCRERANVSRKKAKG